MGTLTSTQYAKAHGKHGRPLVWSNNWNQSAGYQRRNRRFVSQMLDGLIVKHRTRQLADLRT